MYKGTGTGLSAPLEKWDTERWAWAKVITMGQVEHRTQQCTGSCRNKGSSQRFGATEAAGHWSGAAVSRTHRWQPGQVSAAS